MVLCIRTTGGNVARLKVTAANKSVFAADHRTTFDAVIWNANLATPAPG